MTSILNNAYDTSEIEITSTENQGNKETKEFRFYNLGQEVSLAKVVGRDKNTHVMQLSQIPRVISRGECVLVMVLGSAHFRTNSSILKLLWIYQTFITAPHATWANVFTNQKAISNVMWSSTEITDTKLKYISWVTRDLTLFKENAIKSSSASYWSVK